MADIRFCEEADAAQVIDVDRSSPHPWPDSLILSDLRRGDFSYIGAFGAGEKSDLMGYAVLGSEKKNGLLANIVVAPPYRRRGIGAQLVIAAAECAEGLSYGALILRVRVSNNGAAALYKGLGFVETAKRAKYYSDGETASQMILKLPYTLPEDEYVTEEDNDGGRDDDGVPSVRGWFRGLLRW